MREVHRCFLCLLNFPTQRGLDTHYGMVHREAEAEGGPPPILISSDNYEDYDEHNYVDLNAETYAHEINNDLEFNNPNGMNESSEYNDAHDDGEQINSSEDDLEEDDDNDQVLLVHPNYAPFSCMQELAIVYWHGRENTTAGGIDRLNSIGIFNEKGERIQRNKKQQDKLIRDIPTHHPHLNSGSFESIAFGMSILSRK